MFSLFKNKGNTIFANPELLLNSYVPEQLLSRDQEIISVGNVLMPIFNGVSPPNVIIYGKTGCGKTACVRYVIREFEQAIEQQKKITAPFIYITRCVDAKGPIDLIIKTIRTMDKNCDITTGHSAYVYYDKLFETLNNNDRSLILILDEIDAIKNQEFLYMLSRAGEMGDLKKGVFICIIGLTNNLRYPQTMDPRVKSSFGTHWILFPPYNAQDLVAILEGRKTAYREGVLEIGVIPLCAAIAAQEHGDARKAIDLFRTAGDIANRSQVDIITEDHVQRARTELEQEQVNALIGMLPLHSILILFGILSLRKNLREKGTTTLTTGEITQMYQAIAIQFSCNPLTHRRVVDLLLEMAMLGLISTKKRSRGRAQGNVREVWLNLSEDEEKALEKQLHSTLANANQNSADLLNCT